MRWELLEPNALAVSVGIHRELSIETTIMTAIDFLTTIRSHIDGCGCGFVGEEPADDEEELMGIGLIGLLDDIAAIAKVAAASLDDVASQAARAGARAAGVVIDDTAVTPSYVIGFEAKRKLPIVGKIAAGSLRNKLLILLPIALALGYFLPAMITPLLMFGGAYLCYEGVEKVFEAIVPHRAHAHEAQLGTVALNAQSIEDEKVASAIKTDFIPDEDYSRGIVILAALALMLYVSSFCWSLSLIVHCDRSLRFRIESVHPRTIGRAS
ncbi:hypothetical protein V1277_005655 [Bradyrhizobium sp. AZCC 1588]